MNPFLLGALLIVGLLVVFGFLLVWIADDIARSYDMDLNDD